MNTKKNWLKSLAVAAVVSMAAANASAGGVVAAVTANGNHIVMDSPAPVPGMVTPSFYHPGGQLVATFSADCSVKADFDGDKAFVAVDIRVRDSTGKLVTSLSPSSAPGAPFCSSNGEKGWQNWGSYATVRVGTLPPGTYHIEVRGQLNRNHADGVLGARTLVISR